MSEVVWREWGDDAFAEAQQLDRPILLDIGAVWCHWCHVMDHGIPGDPIHTGTYSDPEIIDIINSRFIPIKVDNDRRPDINARYNMGGWPTTAFLTPYGEPLYGATYLTPQQMLGLLESIADYYRDNKDDVLQKVSQHTQRLQSSLEAPLQTADINAGMVVYVESEIKRNFDKMFGGFGTQPKFPHSDTLNLAITRYAETSDDDLRVVAEKTLIEMSSGGMYDQFAGGYFRYSTTRDWSIPHYEKMLEDNARLLITNILAYQMFGDTQYRDIALDVKRFLMEVMYNPATGTFAGSQDADQEDAYYGRPLSERELMPTPYIDRTIYVDWNALAVSAFTQLYRIHGDTAALETAVRLYDFLTKRVAPYHYYLDGKGQGAEHQLTDIEALLGAALDLFESTGSKRYLSEARGLADIAATELLDTYTKLFRDIPESGKVLGALKLARFDQEDNSHMALHLIRLAALTENVRYRNIAGSVLKALAGSYQEQSYFSSAFARSVASFLALQVRVVLVGSLDSPEMENLKTTAYRTFAANKVVELRSPEESGEYPPDADGIPIAYVCVGTVCSQPTADQQTLAKLIKR